MKLIIFSLAFLLLSLTSCKSHKASDFKDAVLQKEHEAFNIILGKKGPGIQKLNYLVKEDYKGAIVSVDRQAAAFDKLIKDIEILPADDIKQGNILKNAAINYYVALKMLHIFDRKEIAQNEELLHLNGQDLHSGQQKLIELARQKQVLYNDVYRKERVLHDATNKFNSVNDIN